MSKKGKDKDILFFCGIHLCGTSVITMFLKIFNINIGSEFPHQDHIILQDLENYPE